jgi:hypothetical protein
VRSCTTAPIDRTVGSSCGMLGGERDRSRRSSTSALELDFRSADRGRPATHHGLATTNRVSQHDQPSLRTRPSPCMPAPRKSTGGFLPPEAVKTDMTTDALEQDESAVLPRRPYRRAELQPGGRLSPSLSRIPTQQRRSGLVRGRATPRILHAFAPDQIATARPSSTTVSAGKRK